MYLVMNVGFILKARDIEQISDFFGELWKYSFYSTARVLFLMRMEDTHVTRSRLACRSVGDLNTGIYYEFLKIQTKGRLNRKKIQHESQEFSNKTKRYI